MAQMLVGVGKLRRGELFRERIMLVTVDKMLTADKFHNAVLFQPPAVPCSNTSPYMEKLWAGPTCLLELLLEAFTWRTATIGNILTARG